MNALYTLDDSPWFEWIEMETIDSTNNFLKSYRPVSPKEMTLVSTDFQTAGRGQANNKWEAEAGKNVILEIEIQGALKVKERFPDTLLLFVTPPSAGELERRLRGRGTETDEVIKSRLKRAVEEAEFMDRYDYILVNDDLETCVQEMHELIQAQRHKTSQNQEFIV